ncbi:serine/threonine protein kinase [Laspinema olomoucense]|uniref:non-specific serine/threonine protein kinase n=1 Tax=Laspinema olomoucense D3b TaxID=2953688 RepID=A0ABT2NEU1_9CYAN|nr:serine/threonine protein kinase [Laspinema sp. D3b]MCT7981223.1 protein kinase [Laspinema sp. D3b]
MNKITILNNRYRIIRELGSGGFGETFLSEDTQMPSERRCVVKQLKPVTANPQIFQLINERFAREAAILEALGEGNRQIPRLYAYFEEQSQFYLVQEWIEGETLTNRVENQGKMSESSVREILISLLPVLEFVHSQRIVHRDIKPDNIMLRKSDGIPILIDFGAVKETMGTVMNSSGNGTSSIVIGTPGFMPSEQAAGRPVYSSDLYSLGLTAIYLLTEKWPQELAINHDTGEVIWRQYAPRISPSLATVLDKAIMSHSRDRFHSPREMLDALTPCSLPGYGIPPAIASPSPVHPVPAPVFVAASPTASSPVVKSSSLGDWQKAGIIGTIIGLFVFLGLWISRPQVATNSSENIAAEPDQTNPEPQKSSPETPDALKGLEAVPARSESLSQIDPKQFIINYYTNLNQRQYNTTWSKLSPNFKTKAGTFADYVEWWESVAEIRVGNVRSIAQTEREAIVDVQLQYLMNDGRLVDDLKNRINLVWDNGQQTWLFDDKFEP